MLSLLIDMVLRLPGSAAYRNRRFQPRIEQIVRIDSKRMAWRGGSHVVEAAQDLHCLGGTRLARHSVCICWRTETTVWEAGQNPHIWSDTLAHLRQRRQLVWPLWGESADHAMLLLELSGDSCDGLIAASRRRTVTGLASWRVGWKAKDHPRT